MKLNVILYPIHHKMQVGKSFLSIAAGYGRVDIMDLLFNRGADVNFQNEVSAFVMMSLSLLHHVYMYVHTHNNRLSQDVHRDTPLMLACEWGQKSAADYLINRKADVNYINKVKSEYVDDTPRA